MSKTEAQPALFEQPKEGSCAHLRAWLTEQGTEDCDCGYMLAHSEYEAHFLTGGMRAPDSYPGWVLTTVDTGCRHHGKS